MSGPPQKEAASPESRKRPHQMKEIVCLRDSHNRGRIQGLATGDRVSINSGAWEEKGSR